MLCSVEASTEEVASSRIKYARVGEQRASDRDALALAAGEREPALAHARVEALRQARRRTRRPARAARPVRPRAQGRAGAPVGDVLGDGRREQERVVADDRHGLAQRAQLDLAHVGAVEQDLPGARVVQSRDQRDEARLARAGRADQRDGAPGGHVQVDVARAPRALRAPRGAVARRVRPRADRSRRRRTRRLRRSAGSRRAAPRGRCRAAAAGRPGGATIRGSRSRTWKMRAPEAVARWARPSVTPSERIGPIEHVQVEVELR